MAVMNISSKASKGFIATLSRDYPQYKFKRGSQEHWSPRSGTITYNPSQPLKLLRYGVLHELAHAQLEHTDYASDFELLKLESLAWRKAARIGRKYGVTIS